MVRGDQQKGGIHGRKIKVIVGEDDKCVPNEAVAVVKKFVTVDKTFIVHGGIGVQPAAVAAQEFVTRGEVRM